MERSLDNNRLPGIKRRRSPDDSIDDEISVSIHQRAVRHARDSSAHKDLPDSPTASTAGSEAAHPPSATITTELDSKPAFKSSSRVQSTPAQLQNSGFGQMMMPTLSAEDAKASHDYSQKVQGGSISQRQMEEMLQQEVHGAVKQCDTFCETLLAFNPNVDAAGIEAILQSQFPGWTIDVSKFTNGESNMYSPAVAILNIISEAAFTPNQFRPRHIEIVDFHNKEMWSEDAEDSTVSPDLLQARPDKAGIHRHWRDVDFFVECKSQPNKFGSALMQLARYARTTFSHQIFRDHIYALAICNQLAMFVRFDRSKILHSQPIDLATDFKKFALAAAGLFTLDAAAFGYDTDFYWFPELAGGPEDRDTPMSLRLRQNNSDWTVLENICQRKCLLGRATTVLRIENVQNPQQHLATKISWKPESRPDEPTILKQFEDTPGIVQCKWSLQGRSTKLPNNMKLTDSPFRRNFLPHISPDEVDPKSSSTNGRKSQRRVLVAVQASLTESQSIAYEPEDRKKSKMSMPEGTSLTRIKRLIHLLIVMRDALVGYAHVVEKDMVHRDISMGNILCDIPKGPNTGHDQASSAAQSERTDYTFMMTYEFPIQEELTDVKSLADYVNKRYRQESSDPQTSIGRISDFEFATSSKATQSTEKTEGNQRTGTWAFISAQLLLTEDTPVPHTYLHDLESFFWVLIWMIVTHTERSETMNGAARHLRRSLSSVDSQALGMFKERFITREAIHTKMTNLSNTWGEEAAQLAIEFALLLEQHLYQNNAALRERRQWEHQHSKRLQPDFDPTSGVTELDQSIKPWDIIKSVIDAFDRRIIELQRNGM